MTKNKPQRHWQQYEIDFVFRSFQLNLPVKEIAIYLDRTISSIYHCYHNNKHFYLSEMELL